MTCSSHNSDKTNHYTNIGSLNRKDGDKICRNRGGRLPLPKSMGENLQLVADLKKMRDVFSGVVYQGLDYLGAADISESGKIDYPELLGQNGTRNFDYKNLGKLIRSKKLTRSKLPAPVDL